MPSQTVSLAALLTYAFDANRAIIVRALSNFLLSIQGGARKLDIHTNKSNQLKIFTIWEEMSECEKLCT